MVLLNSISTLSVVEACNSSKVLIDINKIKVEQKIAGPVLDSNFNPHPWFIVGFTEAEGNFDFNIFNNVKALGSKGIKFRFRLTAKYLDTVLLCGIRNYFGSGSFFFRKDTEVVTLEISSIETIKTRVIPLFEEYPLKGTKYYDYLNWKKGFNDFLSNKDSLESKLALIERLEQIKLILNQNKKEFNLPIKHLQDINGHYVAGFVSGDGSCSVVTGPETFHKGFGMTVFLITQHINNRLLIEAILKYFGVGNLSVIASRKDVINYRVTDKDALIKVIIPFFEKYTVYGLHAVSFYKWKHIIKYLSDKKEDVSNKTRKIENVNKKAEIISNIRSYWLQKDSTSIFNDLSLNYEVLNKNIEKYLN